MEKNEDGKKFNFKELFTNKQYRSIMILIFYAILFVVLIVSIRTPKENVTSSNDGTNVTNVDGYELIDNKNFSYKYTVLVDDEEYIYEGAKYNDKELVTLSKNEEKRYYYIEDDKTYVKENSIYRLTLNKPILIFDFFNTDLLDQLIIRSVLIDEDINRYKIDNQDLYDVLNEDNEKVESGENYITLNYRNSIITEITFELDSYSKVIGENYDKVVISLEYYDFNLIEDFTDITVE